MPRSVGTHNVNQMGRCPLCSKSMDKPTKTIYWQHKNLEFPYGIYHCKDHGAFIWRSGKMRLADFSRLQHEATEEQLPPELEARIQWVDLGYTIVELKCPYCKAKWKQHKEFPPKPLGYVLCPSGHRIPRAS